MADGERRSMARALAESRAALRKEAVDSKSGEEGGKRIEAEQRRAERQETEKREAEAKAGISAARKEAVAKAETSSLVEREEPRDLQISGKRQIGGEAKIKVRGKNNSFISLGEISPQLSEVRFVFGRRLEVNPETNEVTIPIEGEVGLPFLMREAIRAAKKGETRTVRRWKKGKKNQEDVQEYFEEKTWEGRMIEEEMKERVKLAAAIENVRRDFGQIDFITLREKYRKAEMAHSMAKQRAEKALNRLMVSEPLDQPNRLVGLAEKFYEVTGRVMYAEAGGESSFNQIIADLLLQDNDNLVFQYDENGKLILLGERRSEGFNLKAELWDKRQTVQDWRLLRNIIRTEHKGKIDAATYGLHRVGTAMPDLARTFGKGALFVGGGALLSACELVGRGAHWIFKSLLRNPIEGVLAGFVKKYGKDLGLPEIKTLREKEIERKKWMKEEIEKRIRKQ